MQEDADLAIIAPDIAKSVLNLSLVTRGSTSEIVVAHCNAKSSLQLDLMIVIHAISPTLTSIDRKPCILSIATLNNVSSHEIRHGFLCCRAELILGSLCWLEQHTGVSIGIQLTSSIASGFDVVTSIFVNLGNSFNRIRPRLLYFKNLLLGYWWRCCCCVSIVRYRRMVQKDARFAIVIPLVPESVFNLRDSLGASTCKVVGPHGNRSFTIQINLVILELHVGPAFATIDCKTTIFSIAIINSIASDEVGHCICGSWAEGMRSSLCRFEQYI